MPSAVAGRSGNVRAIEAISIVTPADLVSLDRPTG